MPLARSDFPSTPSRLTRRCVTCELTAIQVICFEQYYHSGMVVHSINQGSMNAAVDGHHTIHRQLLNK
jgi:hypothetical protein